MFSVSSKCALVPRKIHERQWKFLVQLQELNKYFDKKLKLNKFNVHPNKSQIKPQIVKWNWKINKTAKMSKYEIVWNLKQLASPQVSFREGAIGSTLILFQIKLVYCIKRLREL